ncbi:glucose-1-phosphate cytidylyltransferase [Clostridium sp. MSJ-8]|uniref:glucose-1-phosphate cytidylyltransferase n=1 Tax=Clostridium sp. MSJ-8 TaxID=2841510 RepID=UPI001C0EB48C|nr:glucose-1-phosphate cytidylyltransferase [Clostridium sp. MSJ-8]MBU5488431.1 glucose-1-phosphate cytidylyltransferase [Clostridium sp. MSJ-8]
MKLVILAGGYGTRLGEIAKLTPKPMVEIGGKPIIWHIMKMYSQYGINEFIICLGYKGKVIKDYFLNYKTIRNDFTIDYSNDSIDFHNDYSENNWKVTLVNTGYETLKGGRLKKVERYLDDGINLLTYGDGVSDVNIDKLIKFHKENKKIVTISGVHPPARFGELKLEGDELTSFEEKSQTSQGYINGGFMVFNKELLSYLTTDDSCDLEYDVFEKLAREGKMAMYKHDGLWACMDTERDIDRLNYLWKHNQAFWKNWD